MYAIVRQVEYDEEMVQRADSELKAFDAVHSGQPGYIGSIVIDIEAGRRIVLNLWDSDQAAAAARRALEAEVGQLLGPLMTSPPQLIGVGDVLSSDLPSLPKPQVHGDEALVLGEVMMHRQIREPIDD